MVASGIKKTIMSDLTAGLILDLEFHRQNKWVATICSPRLVDEMIKRFHCIIMNNQNEFNRYYKDVDFLISVEPGWAAPVVDWRRRFLGVPTRRSKLSYILYSDPHLSPWREKYFLHNKIGYILAFYLGPTLRHFGNIPKDLIVHFPWAIPDDFITKHRIMCRGQTSLTLYGAINSKCYDVRNWCRQFDFVDYKHYSGVENKALSNQDFLTWLGEQDAVIAAGSDDPTYRLTMPKYFEIPAIGALLFAQETDDLEALGFRDMVNCVIFNRSNFEAKAKAYLADPESYLSIRENGRELIRARHSLSVRMDMIERHVREHIK